MRNIGIVGALRSLAGERLREICVITELDSSISLIPEDLLSSPRKKYSILLLLPLEVTPEISLPPLFRQVPVKHGLVVAYAREPKFRLASKGFAQRFRWFDQSKPWPGVDSNLPYVIGVARVAHELGIEQSVIKRVLR